MSIPSKKINNLPKKTPGSDSLLMHGDKLTGKLYQTALNDFGLSVKSTSIFPVFASKYLNKSGKTAEDRIRVLMYGDSVFARDNHSSVLDVIPSEMPPTFTVKNIGAYLWDALIGNKPVYSRSDKAGRFTETGTWQTLLTSNVWDESTNRSGYTRTSTTASAQFSFTATANYFNLIDRTATNGTQSVMVTVPANGQILVKMDGTANWVEANGFIFSQKNVASADHRGNSVFQRRILFKKTAAAQDQDITVTIKKVAADSTMLMYWGIEEITRNTPYLQLLNMARGGYTLERLSDYIFTDVKDKNADLVVFEIPLLNDVSYADSLEHILQWLQDLVFGDRPGFENTWSLSAISDGFTKFDVLFVLPHEENDYYNTDGTSVIKPDGLSIDEYWQGVKGFLYQRGRQFIDVNAYMTAAIDADPLFTNRFDATKPSALNGNTYLHDGVHQNDKGTKIWVNALCPLFSIFSN